MKEMIKRVREEKGGFTLAELLVVVAIILVLVAVAVPVFTGSLANANTAVNEANQRSVKAVASNNYLQAEQKNTDGIAAANGTYYVDENKDVQKVADGGSVPGTAKYAYTVTATKSATDENVTIVVSDNTI